MSLTLRAAYETPGSLSSVAVNLLLLYIYTYIYIYTQPLLLCREFLSKHPGKQPDDTRTALSRRLFCPFFLLTIFYSLSLSLSLASPRVFFLTVGLLLGYQLSMSCDWHSLLNLGEKEEEKAEEKDDKGSAGSVSVRVCVRVCVCVCRIRGRAEI